MLTEVKACLRWYVKTKKGHPYTIRRKAGDALYEMTKEELVEALKESLEILG